MDNSRPVNPLIQNTIQSHHVGLGNMQPQPTHNSPYHVHPYPPPVPLQQAFQSQEVDMFHPKGLRTHQDTREGPVAGRALCLISKDSPVPGRVSHLNEKFQDSVTMYSDTDEIVARISSMFPTVSHTHIRILLKKYYNREAVVISALQVEKHPIATPGPLSMSPSAARLHMGASESFASMLPPPGYPGSSLESGRFTPRFDLMQGSSSVRAIASGSGYSAGARPRHGDTQTRHSSPKMKLKYLKSLFPRADETFILDVLANNDNSVNMAGQDLEAMGFVKKEKVPPKKKEPTPQPVKKVVLMRTVEDRQQVFERLQRKFWSVPEQLILIALETVEYNEEKADHILTILLQERTSPTLNAAEAQESNGSGLLELDNVRTEKRNAQPEANSQTQRPNAAAGPNRAIRQGPQDNLLLEDYMPWNGPNPELRQGQSVRPGWQERQEMPFSTARGPSSLTRGPSGSAQGPSGLARGPSGLARGSMYRNNKK